jgi:hypothetical protein
MKMYSTESEIYDSATDILDYSEFDCIQPLDGKLTWTELELPGQSQVTLQQQVAPPSYNQYMMSSNTATNNNSLALTMNSGEFRIVILG